MTEMDLKELILLLLFSLFCTLVFLLLVIIIKEYNYRLKEKKQKPFRELKPKRGDEIEEEEYFI